MTKLDQILHLMDTRIEILERSNPIGATEKYLRKDFQDLKQEINNLIQGEKDSEVVNLSGNFARES